MDLKFGLCGCISMIWISGYARLCVWGHVVAIIKTHRLIDVYGSCGSTTSCRKNYLLHKDTNQCIAVVSVVSSGSIAWPWPIIWFPVDLYVFQEKWNCRYVKRLLIFYPHTQQSQITDYGTTALGWVHAGTCWRKHDYGCCTLIIMATVVSSVSSSCDVHLMVYILTSDSWAGTASLTFIWSWHS